MWPFFEARFAWQDDGDYCGAIHAAVSVAPGVGTAVSVVARSQFRYTGRK